MPRFLIGWLLSLAGAAIALGLSALIFSGFTLRWDGFIGALVIFAVLTAILPYFVKKALVRYADSITGLTGLISTFLALLITNVLTTGLDIEGVGTWVEATVLIWLLSMFLWAIPGPWRSYRKAKTPQ